MKIIKLVNKNHPFHMEFTNHIKDNSYTGINQEFYALTLQTTLDLDFRSQSYGQNDFDQKIQTIALTLSAIATNIMHNFLHFSSFEAFRTSDFGSIITQTLRKIELM